jgi:hypothetical protein
MTKGIMFNIYIFKSRVEKTQEAMTIQVVAKNEAEARRLARETTDNFGYAIQTLVLSSVEAV